MNDARIAEILKAFDVFDGTYKRTEVDAALELQDEITPHLIGVLEEALADPVAYASDQGYAHIYALVLLGHFREPRAHRVIVELFSLPPDIPYQLFGDLVTETLPIVLFRTCDGSVDLIKSLALNRSADEYCRGSALRALVYAAADGMIPRDDVLAFFSSLFTGDEAAPGSDFWNVLASSVYDLYPQELMGVIEKAYQEGLIWAGFIGHEDFEDTLKRGKEQALNRVKAEIRRRSPDDVHSYMSWWACFQPERSVSPSVSSSVSLREKSRKRSGSSKKAGRKKRRKRVKPARRKKRKRR